MAQRLKSAAAEPQLGFIAMCEFTPCPDDPPGATTLRHTRIGSATRMD
jgi:hypothetical protein